MAELKAEAARLELDTELDCQQLAREAEIHFICQQNELEVAKARQLGAIEVGGGAVCMVVRNRHYFALCHSNCLLISETGFSLDTCT